tara:strand:- start:855 stop:1085 length:231 start_codon:yes stop_codon:yes gene_type:complete
MEQSANQKWKESGTDLPFKEWLTEQQEIGNLEREELKSPAPPENVKTLGVNRNWILVATIAAAAFLIYKYRPASNI